MPHISLDNALGPHPHALALRARRAEVLASNLANADTPGYLARDIDFAAAMRTASSDEGMFAPRARPDPRHLQLGEARTEALDTELAYRAPLLPAIDGNTVSAEHEQSEMARNNLQLMASIQFLGGRFRGLTTALRGE